MIMQLVASSMFMLKSFSFQVKMLWIKIIIVRKKMFIQNLLDKDLCKWSARHGTVKPRLHEAGPLGAGGAGAARPESHLHTRPARENISCDSKNIIEGINWCNVDQDAVIVE